MRVTLALTLAVLLQSEVAIGLDLTYEELKSHLQPIDLQSSGGNQYFFIIVPVQKDDKPNTILHMAQALDAREYANGSLSATKINTADNSVNVSTSGDNLNLDEVFSIPEEDDTSDFNFQVPVIVPLHFHFTYEAGSTPLPECSIDLRTWEENVITKIAEKLQLPGELSWDHRDVTLRIRLGKDALSSITLNHITNTDKLDLYVRTLERTKYLSDYKHSKVLSGIQTLTAEHIAVIAEGFDTYQCLVNSIIVAEEAVDILDSNDASVRTYIGTAKIRINTIKFGADLDEKTGAKESLKKFKIALLIVRKLQEKADMDEEEGEI